MLTIVVLVGILGFLATKKAPVTPTAREDGLPSGTGLGSLDASVSPEQGNFYDQSLIARDMIPMEPLLSETAPRLDGSGPGDILSVMLEANKARMPGAGTTYPLSASELNSPQSLKKPVVQAP